MPFLADYHTHSRYSPDGRDSFPDMLSSAQNAGLSELCVTDHCDMWAPFDCAEERCRAFKSARAQSQTGVKLLLGIELGEGIHNKPLAEERVAGQPYDFIIGSYHALRGELDFYHLRYTSEAHCRQMLEKYFEELVEMADWGCFDVLGHIDYPLRYMLRDGYAIELLPRYEKELSVLFRALSSKGLGIEVNTKSVMPFGDILSLYKQCGGEVLTVGSDAHNAAAIGRGVAEGFKLCGDAGFTHITAFEKRKPRFVSIDNG